jgi:hypothetical protein
MHNATARLKARAAFFVLAESLLADIMQFSKSHHDFAVTGPNGQRDDSA